MESNELLNLLKIKGIETDDAHVLLLNKYRDYILEKNKDINLTAITDIDSFDEKMIFDSALPLVLTDFRNKKIIDVGTGAGFPGMVLSILLDQDVDVLDSTNKKLKVIDEFGNSHVHTHNARVEEFVLAHRESYDIVIARAVAPLPILLELCLPLVKVGGQFIAMKGSDAKQEVEISKGAIKKMGGFLSKTDEQTLPNGDIRINLLFNKLKPTNKKYPRSFGEIKNKPL